MKFYITTSIAYTNAPPHLGFALEAVQADVIARYHRFLKEDVLFLTGTDEHGVKVAKAAAETGKNPKEFVDGISARFRQLKAALNLSNDDFIRTTDSKRHWPAVEKVWLKLKANKDLYLQKYKGLYCPGCEAFITRKDLIEGKCCIHGVKPEIIEEENYFFKLSRYAKKIQKLIEKDKIKIIPESRKNEILNFVRQGLEDVSFSRPRKDLQWGIPVPGDDTQTIYVWADALTNYLSAAGYADNGAKFKKFWPVDVHCIGKDILRFHAVFFPAMLLSLELALPKVIFVHGFITVGGQKMSKSLGNVVDPFELAEKYGTDSVRYFLLREISPTEDGDFTLEKFKARYNADLANGLGNFASRVLALKEQSGDFKTSEINGAVSEEIAKAKKIFSQKMEEFKPNEALTAVWGLIAFGDGYVNQTQPWKIQDLKSKNQIISNLLAILNSVATLLAPLLPETSAKISRLKKGEILFPRL